MCSYSLACSVCKSEYFSKTDWLRHLTTDKHHALARKECLEEWDDKRLKECCLVVFSSFPLTGNNGGGGESGGDRILDYFSRDVFTFVTDFVWWEDRDRIGFVQFESRLKVKDALSFCQDGSAELLIDGKRVQARWALDLLDLEWEAVLPGELMTFSLVSNRNPESKIVERSNNTKSCHHVTAQDATSPGHDKDQGSNSNISSSKTKEVCDNSSLAKLEELAHQNDWNAPKYVTRRTTAPTTSGSAFWCTLKINGVKYEAGGNTKEEARQNAASVCLKAMSFQPTSISDDANNTNSNDGNRKRRLEVEPNVDTHQNGSNPSKKTKIDKTVTLIQNKNSVSLLTELAQRRKFPQPRFLFKQHGRTSFPRFTCTVIVNQVEYKPGPNTVPSKTKKGAKIHAAAYCLRILTSTNADKTSFNDEFGGNQQKTKENETNVFITNELPTCISTSSNSLQYQFWRILNSIKIPDPEYQEKAVKVRKAVKALFCLNDSTAEVVMFRNWFLQLRNPISSDDDVLFYVYNTRTQPSFPSSFTWLPDTTVAQVFSTPEGQRLYTVIEAVDFGKDDPRYKEQLGWKIVYNPGNVSFRILTYKRFFMEAQICRLLEYMCQFDSRCHPLLTLAYYWARVNSCHPGDTEPNGRNSHVNLSEPLTLQWLVMFFLCHKKYIPTPREIQERPHDTLIDRHTEVDVGFHADPDFIQEWKSRRKSDNSSISDDENPSNEVYILSVLLLFQEFLLFCGKTLNSENWILNTRDGELISIENFLTSPPNSGNVESATYWSTKMTRAEVVSLVSLQRDPTSDWGEYIQSENTGEDTEPTSKTPYRVNFRQWKVYIVHPFIFTCKFSISKDIRVFLKKIGSSGLHLKKYLNMRRSNGVKAAERRFGTLENVLISKD